MKLPLRTGGAIELAPSKIVGLLGNDLHNTDDPTGEAVDFFLKAPSSLMGPGGAVLIPAGDQVRLVPECELGVLIGSGGYEITPGRALEHVAGYTIALDLTVRGSDERSRRKSHDTFCPVGPHVVPVDDLGDASGRSVRLHVDGDLVQDWTTDRMVLPVPQVIAMVSSVMTLEPGDLILTGAPKMTRQIAAGEILRAEIGGIGAFEIPVA